MAEIINVLRERVKGEGDEEKNEIYYTPKQKRVLKTIAENPHANASEIADEAGVHPSYIPYIIERVDEGVVDNLHRLDEYLSEQEEMQNTEGSPVQRNKPDETTAELMETFGASGGSSSTSSPARQPTVDDHKVGPDATEFTVTRELPVEITIKFPEDEDIQKLIQAQPELGEINTDELQEAISEGIDDIESEEQDEDEASENEEVASV